MYTTADIKTKINDIRRHYESYINSKYLKSVIMKIDLPHMTMRDMEYIINTEITYIDSKGSLADMYCGIKAIIYFVRELEGKIIPNLHSYSDIGKTAVSTNEQILYQMAIKNFPMNVKILTDLLKQLYDMLIVFDNEHFYQNQAYKNVADFDSILKFFSTLPPKK